MKVHRYYYALSRSNPLFTAFLTQIFVTYLADKLESFKSPWDSMGTSTSKGTFNCYCWSPRMFERQHFNSNTGTNEAYKYKFLLIIKIRNRAHLNFF